MITVGIVVNVVVFISGVNNTSESVLFLMLCSVVFFCVVVTYVVSICVNNST